MGAVPLTVGPLRLRAWGHRPASGPTAGDRPQPARAGSGGSSRRSARLAGPSILVEPGSKRFDVEARKSGPSANRATRPMGSTEWWVGTPGSPQGAAFMQGFEAARGGSKTGKVRRASARSLAFPGEQQQDNPRHFRPHLQWCPAESSGLEGVANEETEAANPSDPQPTTVPIKVASATRVASRRCQGWEKDNFKRSRSLKRLSGPDPETSSMLEAITVKVGPELEAIRFEG